MANGVHIGTQNVDVVIKIRIKKFISHLKWPSQHIKFFKSNLSILTKLKKELKTKNHMN